MEFLHSAVAGLGWHLGSTLMVCGTSMEFNPWGRGAVVELFYLIKFKSAVAGVASRRLDLRVASV